MKNGYNLITAYNVPIHLNDTAHNFGKNFNKNYLWHPAHGFSVLQIPAEYSIIGALPEQDGLLAENNSDELCILATNGTLIKKVKAPFPKGSKCCPHSLINKYVRDEHTGKVYKITPDLVIVDVTNQLPQRILNLNDDIFDVGIDDIKWREGKLYHPSKGLLRDFIKEGMEEFKAPISFGFTKINDEAHIWLCCDFGLYQLKVSRNKFKKYYSVIDSTLINNNSYRNILVHRKYLYCNNEKLGLYRIDTLSGRSEHVIILHAA